MTTTNPNEKLDATKLGELLVVCEKAIAAKDAKMDEARSRALFAFQDELTAVTCAAIARRALELEAEVERLREAVKSQGSVYGVDWQNWKAANALVETLTAERESLRSRVRELSGYGEPS